MNRHIWRVLGGSIRVALFYLPIKVIIFIVSHFDDSWNRLWQELWQTDIPVAGFLLSVGLFYLLGLLTETKLLKWLDKILGNAPFVGPLLTSFNPQASEILRRSKGVIIANFQSGWQIAILTAVHQTQEGYLGSVLYGTIPPTRQLLNESSRIYVLKDGKNGYKMIPTKTAVQQELSSGITVPEDAYKYAVEISFGEFVKYGIMRENNTDAV